MDISQAIEKGNLSFVQEYIQTHQNDLSELLKLFEPNFWADPLYKAIHKNHTEVVKLLLTVKGFDINKKCNEEYGYTYLMCAVNQNNSEIVAALLAYEGIDVNVKSNFNNTALLFAVKKNYVDIAVMLARAGAKTNIYNNNNESAEQFFENKLIQKLVNEKEDHLKNFQEERIGLLENSENDPELTDEEVAAIAQSLAEVSLSAAVNDIEFIQDHLDKIHNLESFKNVLFAVANLIASRGEQDELAHSLYESAAKMGHETAARIVSNYKQINIPHRLDSNSKEKIESLQDLRNARLKFFEKAAGNEPHKEKVVVTGSEKTYKH